MNNVQRVEFDRPVAVIGDVHGNAVLLARLLAQLGDRPVICCGDLCDRGPDTRGVLEALIARGAVSVRGNHEEWLIALCDGTFDTFALHPVMGGRATLDSYGITERTPGAVEAARGRIPASHAAFLKAMPVALDLWVMGTPYWVVHAGVSATVQIGAARLSEVVPWLAQHKPSALLWTQTPPEDTLSVDRTVIMGHMPQARPCDLGSVIAVDTGCGTCAPFALTALLLPERRFITLG